MRLPLDTLDNDELTSLKNYLLNAMSGDHAGLKLVLTSVLHERIRAEILTQCEDVPISSIRALLKLIEHAPAPPLPPTTPFQKPNKKVNTPTSTPRKPN